MPKLKNPTHQQLMALYAVCPGPLGYGCNKDEAARIFGITHSALWQRLKTLRKYFPEAYDQYKTIHNTMKRQKESIRRPNHYSGLRLGKWENKIKEIF